MEYQDWERVARELADMLPGSDPSEILISKNCRDFMSSQLKASSCSAEYTAEALREHIARALEECVIPRRD